MASTDILFDPPEPVAHHLRNGISQPHRRQLVLRHPSDLADVASSSRVFCDAVAKIVDQDIVVLGTSLLIPEDAVKDIQHVARFDLEPGLFQYLAAYTLAKLLAELQHAAGNGPLSFERLGCAAHQQHAVPTDDHCANSDDGPFGIVAFHSRSRRSRSEARRVG